MLKAPARLRVGLRGLRARIVIPMVASLIVLVPILVVMAEFQLGKVIEDGHMDTARAVGALVEALTSPGGQFSYARLQELQPILAKLATNEAGVTDVTIYGGAGGPVQVLASSDPSLTGAPANPQQAEPLATNAPRMHRRESPRPAVEVVVPLRAEGRPVATLGVAYSLAHYEAGMRDQQVRVALAGAVFLIVVTGLAVLYTDRTLTKPILALSAASSRIAAGDLSQEVGITSVDELATLTASFNHMMASLRGMLRKEVEARERLQQQIDHLLQGVGSAAHGDLSQEVVLPDDGQIGKLAKGLNAMLSSLQGLVGGIQKAATELASSATQLNAAAAQQASGASEQAAAASEVSATMEELTRTAQQIAHNAHTTLQTAEQGQAAVTQTIASIDHIKTTVDGVAQRILALGEKSQRIGDITEIIAEIANRTHLLALNAAIESASAGEYGRRFAVVASQVKDLSNETRQSTKQVKSLIAEVQTAANSSVMAAEQATKVVDQGVEMAHQAGRSIGEIVGMAQAINLATQQQRTASEQAVLTMRDVAEVGRQAAAGSRETAESASRLNSTAEELRSLAATFRT